VPPPGAVTPPPCPVDGGGVVGVVVPPPVAVPFELLGAVVPVGGVPAAGAPPVWLVAGVVGVLGADGVAPVLGATTAPVPAPVPVAPDAAEAPTGTEFDPVADDGVFAAWWLRAWAAVSVAYWSSCSIVWIAWTT
jgi:hypothetical protein